MKMRAVLAALLFFSVHVALSYDETPLGTYTYKGITLLQAQIVGVSQAGVTLSGKGGQTVMVPWEDAKKDFHLKGRLKKEIAMGLDAPKPAGPVFGIRILYYAPDGSAACILYEVVEIPDALLGTLKRSSKQKENLFLKGLDASKLGDRRNLPVKLEELVEEGGTMNLSPEYDGLAVKVYRYVPKVIQPATQP